MHGGGTAQGLTLGRAVRAVLLLCAAGATALLAGWVTMLSSDGAGGFILRRSDEWVVASVPTWVMGLAGLLIVAGIVAAAASWRLDARLRHAAAWLRDWAHGHRAACAFLVLVAITTAVDVYELLYDPFNHRSGLRPYMLREDLRAWLLLGAAGMAALAFSTWWPDGRRLARWASRVRVTLRRGRVRLWLALAAVPLVLGTVMAAGALERIPHFSDSLTTSCRAG